MSIKVVFGHNRRQVFCDPSNLHRVLATWGYWILPCVVLSQRTGETLLTLETSQDMEEIIAGLRTVSRDW